MEYSISGVYNIINEPEALPLKIQIYSITLPSHTSYALWQPFASNCVPPRILCITTKCCAIERPTDRPTDRCGCFVVRFIFIFYGIQKRVTYESTKRTLLMPPVLRNVCWNQWRKTIRPWNRWKFLNKFSFDTTIARCIHQVAVCQCVCTHNVYAWMCFCLFVRRICSKFPFDRLIGRSIDISKTF